MALSLLFGTLAALSLGLTLWQWLAARRFPLHERQSPPDSLPGVTLLKPLKGRDAETRDCLRRWLLQVYPGPVQLLFGVASAEDPVCALVRELVAEHARADARLVVCADCLGPNQKVSTLAQLQPMARHDLWVVSDADVRVPPDFLAHAVLPFRDADVGLVNPFYSLANPTTLAMRWEAVAVNADFWSSVLQARLLGPIDFALGAAMAVRRSHVERMGGFLALARHLADDFELGHRVALQGGRVVLCPVVVDCWDAPRSWAAVWRHQVRWARTIRVCRPGPYGWSLLSNATLWPLLALIALPRAETALAAGCCLVVRLLTAADNQRRLTRSWRHGPWLWLAPVKDLLQVALWALAFLGHRVEWRGQHFRVSPSGELEPVTPNQA